jgi:hypothetical protein
MAAGKQTVGRAALVGVLAPVIAESEVFVTAVGSVRARVREKENTHTHTHTRQVLVTAVGSVRRHHALASSLRPHALVAQGLVFMK